MKTAKEAFYHQGLFRYSEKGWPKEPKHDVKCHSKSACKCAELAFESGSNRDVVDGYDDNCPHRYQQVLSLTIKESVPFEDQDIIKSIVEDSLYEGDPSLVNIKEGLYTFPEVEGDVVEVPEFPGMDHTSYPTFINVFRIKPSLPEGGITIQLGDAVMNNTQQRFDKSAPSLKPMTLVNFESILIALKPDKSLIENKKLTAIWGNSADDGLMLMMTHYDRDDYVFSLFENRKLLINGFHDKKIIIESIRHYIDSAALSTEQPK